MAEASHSLDNNLSLTAGSEVTFDIVCTPCDNCGEVKEADSYCHDCKEYLCTTCLKYHNKLAGSKHHTLVEKNNLPGTRGTLPVSDICTQRCQTHSDQIIQFYCPSHKKLGCGVCMVSSHDTCKGKIHIPDKAKTFTDGEEFQSFKALLEQLRKSSDIIIESSQTNIKHSADYRVAALQEIETFRQNINVALDEMKAALDDQSQEITARDEASMNLVSDKISTVKSELQQMSSEFDTLLNKGQKCQMFIKMKTSKEKLADLQRQLEEVETSCITAFRFKPNDDVQNLVMRKDSFGELLVKKPNEMHATHVSNINVRSTENNVLCGVSASTLLCTNKLVIIDFSNKAVKLVDTDLQQIMSEYKPEKPPMDITKVNYDRIAITLPDANRILLMKAEETLSTDTDIRVDHMCWRIACIDDKLIVSFKNPNEVKQLSLTGETLQTFSTSNMGDRLFSSPPRVYVSAITRNIYISEWKENRVTMLDMEGNFIAEYKDGALRSPAQSAVDDIGNVFVCGNGSNNIHLLTTYLSNVKILLAQKDGIRKPRSISYCGETSKLYVGMWDNDNVQVYKLS